jgi:hypothetical protein
MSEFMGDDYRQPTSSLHPSQSQVTLTAVENSKHQFVVSFLQKIPLIQPVIQACYLCAVTIHIPS